MTPKPKTIKILDVTYTVEYVDKPSEVDIFKRESMFGQIDYWTRSIRIFDKDRSDQDVQRTIWHEILHGIVEQIHIKWATDSDEDIVDRLALGINSVCHDNGVT